MPIVSSELLAMTRVCNACGHRKLKDAFKSSKSRTCMACQRSPAATQRKPKGDREDLEELYRFRVVIASFPTPNTNTTKE